MSSKAPRIILATIALVSLAGLASPAEAAPAPVQRNVWCC
jgi:hypothetical protein